MTQSVTPAKAGMTVLRMKLVVVGLAVAAIAFLLAFAMAGAGHGWVQPFLYSMGMFLAYPLVLVRRTATGRKWFLVDLVIVALGALFDLLLIVGTYRTEAQYFERVFATNPVIPLLWILFWAGWQLVALNCLMKDREDIAWAEAS